MNMYRLDKIVVYLLNHLPNWNFTFDNLVQPEFLRISQWSKTVAQDQATKLAAIRNTISEDSFLNRHKRRNIDKAIKIITTNCTQDHNDFSKLHATNQTLDDSRGTNLRLVHPLLVA